MAQQVFKNNAASTLNGTLAIGATTLNLPSGHGSRFPAPSAGEYGYVTLYEKDAGGNEITYEIVKVTGITGDSMTVVRDIEGLVAAAGGTSGGWAYPSSVGVNPSQVVYVEQRYTAYAANNTLNKDGNLAGLASQATSRANLGLGTMATQDANNVNITGGSITGATTVTDAMLLVDDVDPTKKMQFQLSAIGAGLTRTLTVPNEDITLAGRNVAQTFNGLQTFANGIAGTIGPDADSQHTLPNVAADTVTLNAAAQTLTNKTLTAPVLVNPSYSGTTANGGTVTTIDINGGTVDGAVIGATTPAAGTFTTLTATGNATLGDAEATDTHAVKGVTTVLANSASAALTVTQAGAGYALLVSGGNAGFGTATPTYNVDVYSATNANIRVAGDAATSMRVERYSTDTTAPQLALRKSRGSLSAATAVATSDALGNILFQGYGGSTTRNLASVAATVSAYVSDTDIATYLTINTSAAGGITATEGFRIASDKTTTLGGTSTAPAFKIFPVASQVNYLAASASATGNSVAFSALGTDTNINVSHQSKGTGGFFFGTNAGATTQVVITDTASANRYITLTGSNGGNPTIGTSGGSLAVSTGLAVPSDSACGGIWYMKSGTAIPAGGVQAIGVSSTATMGVYFGSGAPTVSAAKGSLYLRSDGSTTNDRMYVNTNGTTTWTAVTTAA